MGESELTEIDEVSQRADIGDRIVFKAQDPGVLEPPQWADVRDLVVAEEKVLEAS